jgi:hypothetical protein
MSMDGMTVSSAYGAVDITGMDRDEARAALAPVLAPVIESVLADRQPNALTTAMAGLVRPEGDTTGLYPVPADEAFKGGDWYDGGDVAGIALNLRERFPELLGFHKTLSMHFLWKRKGGKAMGMCVRVGGTAKAFAPGTDFLIWLAADHCRETRLSAYQIEALTFHELLHVALSPKGKPALRKHDWEGFRREIVEYGMWLPDVQAIGEAFQQLRLEA